MFKNKTFDAQDTTQTSEENNNSPNRIISGDEYENKLKQNGIDTEFKADIEDNPLQESGVPESSDQSETQSKMLDELLSKG